MKKNTTKPVNDKFTEIISETDSQYKLTAIESKVKQAAAAVEKAESAETLAKDDLDCIERDLAKMKADQQQANECYRKAGKAKAAAYWRLGDAIRVLETALESRKGKHHSITPRKRAIELAGVDSLPDCQGCEEIFRERRGCRAIQPSLADGH